MSYHVPECYRVPHPFGQRSDYYDSEPGDDFGIFDIPRGRRLLCAIASSGTDLPADHPALGWEHVSVSVRDRGGSLGAKLPTWEEMVHVKHLFWHDEDCVVQFHPPASQHVDNADVLHLWRCTAQPFPMPHPTLVGFAELGRLQRVVLTPQGLVAVGTPNLRRKS